MLRVGVGVAVVRQRDTGDEGVVRVEGDGRGLERDERTDHETGEGEQRERERDLRNDKAAEQALLGAAGGGARAALRCGVPLRAGAAPRGRHAEDEDGEARDRERCSEHRKVERDDGFVRNGLRGHDAQDDLQAGVGEGESDGQRDECEGERLRESSACEAPS